MYAMPVSMFAAARLKLSGTESNRTLLRRGFATSSNRHRSLQALFARTSKPAILHTHLRGAFRRAKAALQPIACFVRSRTNYFLRKLDGAAHSDTAVSDFVARGLVERFENIRRAGEPALANVQGTQPKVSARTL